MAYIESMGMKAPELTVDRSDQCPGDQYLPSGQNYCVDLICASGFLAVNSMCIKTTDTPQYDSTESSFDNCLSRRAAMSMQFEGE